VSVRRLRDLREAIQGRQSRRIDQELYEECLAGFRFEPPPELPGARSLIVVAYRDPPVRLTVRWRGITRTVTVPPTYLRADQKDARARGALEALLGPRGWRVAPALLPKKLLAVRSGLGSYGRNNLCYVQGMGSYHRLAVFFSDLPCERDRWRKVRMLERCRRCDACLDLCPTGAISRKRFLLHAERCITYWNEKPPVVPFPGWIDGAWHNSLVGCMRCQQICPENREMRGWREEGPKLGGQEVHDLLTGVPLGQMSKELARTVKDIGLEPYLDVIPRNLEALLQG
jgi:epoxyqueuosine reductase